MVEMPIDYLSLAILAAVSDFLKNYLNYIGTRPTGLSAATA